MLSNHEGLYYEIGIQCGALVVGTYVYEGDET